MNGQPSWKCFGSQRDRINYEVDNQRRNWKEKVDFEGGCRLGKEADPNQRARSRDDGWPTRCVTLPLFLFLKEQQNELVGMNVQSSYFRRFRCIYRLKGKKSRDRSKNKIGQSIRLACSCVVSRRTRKTDSQKKRERKSMKGSCSGLADLALPKRRSSKASWWLVSSLAHTRSHHFGLCSWPVIGQKNKSIFPI